MPSEIARVLELPGTSAPAIATLFGLVGQGSPATAIAAIPIALWEFSLGIYLVAKGFKPSYITSITSGM